MPSKADVIKHIETYADDTEMAFVIWLPEDVIQQAKERKVYIPTLQIPKLEQAKLIIDKIHRKHDCTIGITWDTLDFYTDDYFDNKVREMQSNEAPLGGGR